MIFYALKFDKTEFKNHRGPGSILHTVLSPGAIQIALVF